MPAVRILELTWAQQYRHVEGHVQRLTPKEMVPVSEWYRSPYDPEVRYGRKRDFDWIGYKVHLTECCDDDLPHLVTQVETAPATQQDHHALQAIQAELADKHLLPQQHLVDAGYISAKRILQSRDQHAIELVGPVHVDPSWQAHTPGAFDVSSLPHRLGGPRRDVSAGQAEHRLVSREGCQRRVRRHGLVCSAHLSGLSAPGTVHHGTGDRAEHDVRFPPERHEMLLAARARQQTPEFHDVYQARCGIEGTFSQTTRNTGMRRARYIGQPKTHLQHLFTALATNILRLVRWLEGIPFAKTRTSRFAALAA